MARHAFVRRLLPVLVVFGALARVQMAWAAGPPKQVLVVYNTRPDAQIAIIGDRELPHLLSQGTGGEIDFYTAYIDRARFREPGYESAFTKLLRLQFEPRKFDVVITIGDSALDFIERHRDELFPGVPIVFFVTQPLGRRPPNATGLIVATNLRGTVDLAFQLQPDVKNVFVVSGATSEDRAFEAAAREQLGSVASGRTITYLAGMRRDDLEHRLATLPEHSLVYYLVVNADADGVNVHPLEYVQLISAVANAPVYSWVDSVLGQGAVGGVMKEQLPEIRDLGGLAVRVLRGERADEIATDSPNLYGAELDWRELRRWGISEARVPAGTFVMFRQPSVWTEYRTYIVATAVLLVAETVLIGALITQHTRRRRAEEVSRARDSQLRHLGARLLNAQENERGRLARELHDDIGQKVAVLAFDLQAKMAQVEGAGRKGVEDLARFIHDKLDEIAKELHDVSHALHPAHLQLIGIAGALEGLRREFSVRDLTVTFSHDRLPSHVAHEITLCLFRVAQEALQNAAKHSRARVVRMSLRFQNQCVLLDITDDGDGFDPDGVSGTGLGLISMRERVESLGGTISIQSKNLGGTHISVIVPMLDPLE